MTWLWASLALASQPVAVVELFTSQGCSSCPAADEALAELVEQVESSGAPVYALSFHVDYWDRLGWKDPYSDARWTGRQQSYAKTFASKRIYTPQAIVNGANPFVGSQKDQLAKHVLSALETEATTSLKGVAKRSGAGVHVEVTALGAPLGGELFIVVVEDQATTPVKTGENAGKTSIHRNIVRAMVRADLPGTSGTIPVPDGFEWNDAKVFAWVSDPLTLQIVGASKLPLVQ